MLVAIIAIEVIERVRFLAEVDLLDGEALLQGITDSKAAVFAVARELVHEQHAEEPCQDERLQRISVLARLRRLLGKDVVELEAILICMQLFLLRVRVIGGTQSAGGGDRARVERRNTGE